MTVQVAINGSFLNAKTGGIIRVGSSILRAIDGILCSRSSLRKQIAMELLLPKDIAFPAPFHCIEARQVGGPAGQVWEQLEFPAYSMGRLALNFTSTAPAIKHNCVTVIHDAQMFLTPGSFQLKQRVLHQLLTPLNGRMHRSVITVSSFSLSQLERFWVTPRGKGIVIHNSAEHIKEAVSDHCVLERAGLRGRRYVLARADPTPHKNLTVLFHAMSLMHRADVALVLFGDALRSRFSAERYPGMDKTIFTGPVTDGELKALLEKADIFAFPSKTEGFGLPPLEAMTLGCPTVVSDAGAMPEVCRDGVVYAAADDPSMWARCLARVLDEAQVATRLRRRGPEVAGIYSWRDAAEKYLNVLLEITENGR